MLFSGFATPLFSPFLLSPQLVSFRAESYFWASENITRQSLFVSTLYSVFLRLYTRSVDNSALGGRSCSASTLGHPFCCESQTRRSPRPRIRTLFFTALFGYAAIPPIYCPTPDSTPTPCVRSDSCNELSRVDPERGRILARRAVVAESFESERASELMVRSSRLVRDRLAFRELYMYYMHHE